MSPSSGFDHLRGLLIGEPQDLLTSVNDRMIPVVRRSGHQALMSLPGDQLSTAVRWVENQHITIGCHHHPMRPPIRPPRVLAICAPINPQPIRTSSHSRLHASALLLVRIGRSGSVPTRAGSGGLPATDDVDRLEDAMMSRRRFHVSLAMGSQLSRDGCPLAMHVGLATPNIEGSTVGASINEPRIYLNLRPLGPGTAPEAPGQG